MSSNKRKDTIIDCRKMKTLQKKHGKQVPNLKESFRKPKGRVGFKKMGGEYDPCVYRRLFNDKGKILVIHLLKTV